MSSNSLASTMKPSFFSGTGCWGGLAVIGASLFLYIVACALPAMVFSKETWRGYEVLLAGWQGVFLGQFAWFANLFWFLSLFLVFLRRWFLTIGAMILTFLIALDSLSFVGANIPLDEANVNSMTFQAYSIGFYFWLASFVAVGIGAVVMWLVTQRTSSK